MKEKMWKKSQELNELRCDSEVSTELEEHELEAISGGCKFVSRYGDASLDAVTQSCPKNSPRKRDKQKDKRRDKQKN